MQYVLGGYVLTQQTVSFEKHNEKNQWNKQLFKVTRRIQIN